MNLKEKLKESVGKKIINSSSEGFPPSCCMLCFENKRWFSFYSTWRIEHKEKVVTTSFCENLPKVLQISQSVRQLEGHKLLSFELSEQYDLVLFFEEGYVFRCFCVVPFLNTTENKDYRINWIYCIPDKDVCYKIGNDYQIKRISYNEML